MPYRYAAYRSKFHFPSTVRLREEERKRKAEPLRLTPEPEYYRTTCEHCGRLRVWSWRRRAIYCTKECAAKAKNKRAIEEKAMRVEQRRVQRWREDEAWLMTLTFLDLELRDKKRLTACEQFWFAARAAARMTEVPAR